MYFDDEIGKLNDDIGTFDVIAAVFKSCRRVIAIAIVLNVKNVILVR